ncbi:MAG TPA: hypothetical protein VF456_23045 [Vicinamibacterales bacterium]
MERHGTCESSPFSIGDPAAIRCSSSCATVRRWISKDDYKRGLALAQLVPGPLPAQLAIYLR